MYVSAWVDSSFDHMKYNIIKFMVADMHVNTLNCVMYGDITGLRQHCWCT